MVAFTIFGCVISIVTIKLIQNNFDYFSLKAYKVVWGCLLILFCMNLFFLLLFNEIMVYNRGICQFGVQVLSNRSHIEEVFPQAKTGGGMYYVSSCYYGSNFRDMTYTGDFIAPISTYLSLKQKMLLNYTAVKLSTFPTVLTKVKDKIQPFQFGEKGTYPTMDNELSAINVITNNDYQNESCFKHRWKYVDSQCGSG